MQRTMTTPAGKQAVAATQALVPADHLTLKGARRWQGGSSLIEVLVSLLLISFGMLAMGAMQGYALAASKNSGHRGVAATLASEAADVLRANPQGLSAAGYDLTGYLSNATGISASQVLAAKCSYPACTPTTLAAYDLERLKSRVRSELPNGGLQLVRPTIGGVQSTTEADLWIVWLEPKTIAHQAGSGLDAAAEKNFDGCPAEAKALTQIPRCFYMRVVL
jgi:type IV pilus assembly protein PilV